MSDYLKNQFDEFENQNENNASENEAITYEDIASSSEPVRSVEASPAAESAASFETAEAAETAASDEESSYEWNTDKAQPTDSEYHYSYVNGSNSAAPHNPNNYDNAYSAQRRYGSTGYSSYQQPQQSNAYGTQYRSGYNSGYTSQQYQQPQQQHAAAQPKKTKTKKEKKPASRGFIAAMLAITMLASAALGFGGGYLAKNMNTTTSGNLTINQVSSGSVTNASAASSATTTSDIVKKTADSVVEIATEGITTGSFARQYVTKGAGSGVIISSDGYIVTNHHVIDGASTIKVTLRDGTTSYDATLIGSDEDNDIALLKIEAEGLTPATFGDSSSLAVGDYVVAIGNPLGTLGGTVTDGIISALAREVTIEDKNMTLLQTNAQISPGNSGGGLFNSKGELIGIVNAKDSATEVEGIAFAIPVNNVIDIIKDLQNYGYVTGKIDMGMEFVDINSNDTAFYYGVNQLGCYVLSVQTGSNAEAAGFRRGDLITAVNGQAISSSGDISKALENNKVGDTVTLTVSRSGQTTDLQLTLAEYKPSAKLNSNANSDSGTDNSRRQSTDELWNQLFGW